MRAVIAVVFVGLLAAAAFAGAAFASAARTTTPATAEPRVVAPRATADPGARVPPDASLELDRAFIADLVDRPRSVVRGLTLPIAGASIPNDPLLLPYSARTYRSGVHEGVDFAAPLGTPVHAAAAGTIVRIDTTFSDWTPAQLRAALIQAHRLGRTPAATLDRIRGRQVWIDHGHGIVTRYAHLSAVAAGWAVGGRVEAGTLIGFVGSSGYPEGGPHLHFEVRIGRDYLGDGASPEVLHGLLERAFS